MPVKKPALNRVTQAASRAGVNDITKNGLAKSAVNSPLKKESASPNSSAKPTLAALSDKVPPVKKSQVSDAAKTVMKKDTKVPASKMPVADDKGTKNLKASINGKGLPGADFNAGDLPKAGTKLKESLEKQAAGSAKSSMRIFQIYYESWHKDLLDPMFAGLDNSKSSSELLEFAVFEQLAKSEHTKEAELWGAISWRFTEKTGMSGSDLVKNIQSHPGYDVYYCNPFPHNEALFHNYWLQGVTTHPQFFPLCQAIFEVAGLPLEELTALAPSDQFSAANYFVGSPKFWAAYLPWVNGILSTANKKLPPKVRDLMHSKQADDRGIHNGATYVPFIVERLLPAFLKTAGKSLKAYKVALPERERELNVHLKLLREMKDVAHRTKSAWLAVCWANYRNLYLTQISGKEWSKKYLPAITPTEVKFS